MLPGEVRETITPKSSFKKQNKSLASEQGKGIPAEISECTTAQRYEMAWHILGNKGKSSLLVGD